ncbi:amino acid ABC transporter ATP-binding protein [Tanticharoenia sakaeratensis]|jgi:ABC-type polar amino acid transport system ATPase subunit|uniref:ABC transporter n=1 Tax=Tanticharoenia sakaeratensis NBRC 103193 TaxID=1231623 RepID=A0A0D6MK13_9PROT|nr:amino acid ABC transporter ATP-binding protein [Tanticharoenia sakaeratensis]GAN53972.1 ABC transporter [Tanticharoenia sakaeratensis NBRC 103193]GBQ23561.1 amino acid transporter ATP-binding protein [Tanticharoenia sakaeratensis NBRC 103193]
MSDTRPFLALRNIELALGGKPILRDCTLNVDEGEVVVILGPSGSGKSTLLRCVNLLERPDHGQILFRGDDLLARHVSPSDVRRTIGMVFQGYHLFEHLNVRENLLLAPRKIAGRHAIDMAARAAHLLECVGLSNHADHYPHELSGGQQQRIAIARALVMQPALMLFDEPTSALDPEATEQLQMLFDSPALEGMTKLVVTHDIGFARRIADRIVFMEDGVIVADMQAETFFSGQVTPRLHRFLTRAMPEFAFAAPLSEEDPSCDNVPA